MVTTQEFAQNLGLALLLGGLIGLEREYRDRDAGIRTNALVAAGAAIFAMVSRTLDDGGRVTAQIVTGIGFLGAGNIMRSGEHIRGLTTAATLWTVAAIGTVAGLGLTKLAVMSGGGVLLVNFILVPCDRWIAAYHTRRKLRAAMPDSAGSQT